MQDFDPAACRYYPGPDSIYPAYLFSVSARDLARFGLLYLHRGQWAGRQIVPAQWVDDSAKPYSRTDRGFGYGYLWWVALAPGDGGDTPTAQAMHLPPGSYFAQGNHGQRIFVIPAADMVVIHLARAEPSGGVGTPRVAQLMGLILDAAPR
jgi:CubicO group peptidase (beta-lactamase class C family)